MSERALANVCFAAMGIIWGTTFLAIRVAIETIPTLYLTGMRFTIAGTILLAIALARGNPLPLRASQWGHESLTGVLLFTFATASVAFAEHYITSGLAALLAAMLPLWMAVLERREPFTTTRIAGLVAGFCGVAAVVAPAIAKPSTGTGLVIGTLAMQFYTIAWNLGTLRAKYKPSGVAPGLAPAMQMLTGGVITLVAAILIEPWPRITAKSAIALSYLALFGSVIAFSAYTYALRVIPPGRLTLFAYIQPAVAAIAGAIVLHERITIPMLLGMLFILGGVTLARRTRTPSAQAATR